MSEEEKFEELIRQKFAEKEFVFNEENWEKAEQKISSNRRNKKIGWWSSLFVLGLVCGIAIMYPFINKENKNLATIIKENRNESTVKENTHEEINTNEQHQKVLETSTRIYSRAEAAVAEKKDEGNIVNNNVINSGRTIKENKNSIHQLKSIPQKLSSSNINYTKEKEADIKTSISKTNDQKNNLFVSSVHEVKENESANIPLNIVSSINEQTKTQTDSVSGLVVESKIKILSKDSSQNISDSVGIINENKSTPLPAPLAPGLASTTFFSIDVGTNIELGWKTGDVVEGRGFNPIIGVSVLHFFNPTWDVTFGAQYGSIAYLKASEKIYSRTSFGFGSAKTDTVIDTKYLHYAVIPFMLHYNFNNKNAVSIGGSVSYLINTKSKVSVNTTTVGSTAANSNQANETQKTATGYYASAFNKWDASLAVGYRRRFTEKLSATIIANVGLLDIKNNTFFSNNQYERNSGVKLIITYNLFDFK